jgi:quercetin 2,3-dioxygenase
MIVIRRGSERFHTEIGWLDSRHTFSFGDHHDPEFMGFRSLRVINEDKVRGGAGFPTHPHRDMEILSYVLAGALEHKDSLGTGSVIRPGDVQRMSAGTGVLHSEYNPSPNEPTHFLQIWIIPERRGLPPSYEQRAFPMEQRRNRLRLVAAQHPQDGALEVHQDMKLFATVLDEGQRLTRALDPERFAWVQVARGSVMVNGEALSAGDGAALGEESSLELVATSPAELLVFDLA